MSKEADKLVNKGFAHESSKNKTIEWYTPKYIFDAIGLTFDLDPCSPGKDIVPWIPVKDCYVAEQDGLMLPWHGNVWMNPPYGKNTPAWFERLSLHGTGIALLFARTGTAWFQRYAPIADAICFVKGRIPFVSENAAKSYAVRQDIPTKHSGADSILVAFGKDNAKALYESGLGLTLTVKGQTAMFEGK